MEADFFVGVSLGTAFPDVHHQAPRTIPVGRLRGHVPAAQHPAAQGPLLGLDGDDEFGKWADTPLLPWKPVVSFDAFGPDILEPPEGVMAATPLYVGTTWDVE